jgi:GcrA cell cycle regulator
MGGASHWTEILEEELRQRWAAGTSATVIAKELGNGITRNAVIGKANRLNLPPHKRANSAEPPTRRPYKQRKVRVLITRQLPPEPPEVPRPPKMRRLALLDLEPHHCRWPVGNPARPDFFFCAADTYDGAVYCPWHMRAAFVQRKGA